MFVEELWINLSTGEEMKRVAEMTTPELRRVIKRLKEALAADAGERPAMAYADICEEDYRLITERHPEIVELAKKAGGKLGAKASINIKDAIEEGDLPTSKWYKEHTDERYMSKVKVEGGVNLSADDREKAIEALFEEI